MNRAPAVTAGGSLTVPAIGFGTYGLNGLPALDVIRQAVASGYRLFDAAFNYENEGAVGAALRSASVPREELLITSKLPGRHHAHDEANALKIGDVARIVECAPKSKLKRWEVLSPNSAS